MNQQFPDFITFLCHHIAYDDNQRFTWNNQVFWVAHAKNVFQFQRTAILAVAFHPFPFSTLMM